MASGGSRSCGFDVVQRCVCVCKMKEASAFRSKSFEMTQEHRMAGVGRDLRRSSSSMLLLQQDQLELVVQYTVVRF